MTHVTFSDQGNREGAARPAPPRPGPDDGPVLPARSPDDTDIGWGERPEPDDEERYRRDRPPHWGSD
jgi:hypothetical protein